MIKKVSLKFELEKLMVINHSCAEFKTLSDFAIILIFYKLYFDLICLQLKFYTNLFLII